MQTRLTMHDHERESFTLSGVVKRCGGKRAALLMPAAVDRGQRRSSIGHAGHGSREEEKFVVVGAEGRFDMFLNSGQGAGKPDQYLGRITVDRDIEGLELTPQPPTGVRGAAWNCWAPRRGDRVLTVGWAHGVRYGVGLWKLKRVRPSTGPDGGMPPGNYILRLNDPDAYIVDSPVFSVALGQMVEMTVRISNEFATVRGRVRAASGGKPVAAHSVVGMRGERGTHTAKADDEGRFVIEGDPRKVRDHGLA
ncbi:MAG: hypothetical protein R2748_12870 [Bryobacterales bacterium]